MSKLLTKQLLQVSFDPFSQLVHTTKHLDKVFNTIAVLLYQLCGDNIDKNVKQRYFRTNKTPGIRSLHYFHYYAVKDRVDFSGMGEECIACTQTDLEQVALSLLPTPEDDEVLKTNICTIVSRILFSNVPYFKQTFDGVIDWHLEHQYSHEMSQPSEWVNFY